MKMRRIVVVEVHCNRYAQKPAQFWHSPHLLSVIADYRRLSPPANKIITCAITNRNHCHADAFATACFYVGKAIAILQRLPFALGKSLCFCNAFLSRWGSHCSFATASFCIEKAIALLQRPPFVLGKPLQFCNGFLLHWESHCAFATPSFCAGEAIAVLQRFPFVLGRSLQFCNARPLREDGYCHSASSFKKPLFPKRSTY